jgi:hypothetical protein
MHFLCEMANMSFSKPVNVTVQNQLEQVTFDAYDVLE